MQIRKATMEDREGVINLLRTLLIPGGEVPEDWRDEAQIFRLLVENPELGTILIAEENGEIAGITTLSYPTALRCCGLYSCIEENIVDERYRGRGIGGALLKAAIAEATARGCDELQVNAPSESGIPSVPSPRIQGQWQDPGEGRLAALRSIENSTSGKPSMMDFNEIQKRREQLAEGPVFAIPEERVADLAGQLARRASRSKQLYDAATRCIPGGAQHMLIIKNPHPLTIERSLGARVWDVDGNEYIDYLMMAGPIILGHNYPPLIEKVVEVIQGEGIGSGWTSEWEIKSAELIIRHMKNVEMVRFFQSGTEADMAAVRLARAYTGKTKLLRIGGSYHGWADEFVYDMQVPYSGTFQTQGIPEQHFSNVISVGPGDVERARTGLRAGRWRRAGLPP